MGRELNMRCNDLQAIFWRLYETSHSLKTLNNVLMKKKNVWWL